MLTVQSSKAAEPISVAVSYRRKNTCSMHQKKYSTSICFSGFDKSCMNLYFPTLIVVHNTSTIGLIRSMVLFIG